MAHLPQWKSIIAMDKKRKGRKMPFSYLFPRGIKWQRKSAAGFSPHRVGDADKGDILFLGKRISPLHPQEKGIRLAVWSLNHLFPSGMGMPARQSRVSIAIRFASTPIIRCRSAHLVEVHSNSRLPPVSTMRRAPAMPHSVSSLPPF